MMKANSRIYLAVPSSLAHCSRDPGTRKELRAAYVEDFKHLIQQLKEHGFFVDCALDDCLWDEGELDEPAASVQMDWDRINGCTQVIACPSFGLEPSGGVHVEIGWATALRIPLTILAAKSNLNHSALIGGLQAVKALQCEIFYYPRRPRDVFPQVLSRVFELETMESVRVTFLSR